MIVGSGTEFSKVQTWFTTNTPGNALLLAGLPKNEYDQLIQSCDVGLIFLDRRFTIPNFPSRMLSYLEYKMPTSFLTSLYSFLIQEELVFVFKKEDKTIGFVSCSLNSGGIMKKFLLSCPSGLVKLVWMLAKKPKMLIPLLETFRAPEKSKSNLKNNSEIKLPKTELLSISVDPSFQKENIGTQLLHELEQCLRTNGINKYKVIAGETLIGANKFYLKNGFVLATQIKIHGDSLSNVYTKEL